MTDLNKRSSENIAQLRGLIVEAENSPNAVGVLQEHFGSSVPPEVPEPYRSYTRYVVLRVLSMFTGESEDSLIDQFVHAYIREDYQIVAGLASEFYAHGGVLVAFHKNNLPRPVTNTQPAPPESVPISETSACRIPGVDHKHTGWSWE